MLIYLFFGFAFHMFLWYNFFDIKNYIIVRIRGGVLIEARNSRAT